MMLPIHFTYETNSEGEAELKKEWRYPSTHISIFLLVNLYEIGTAVYRVYVFEKESKCTYGSIIMGIRITFFTIRQPVWQIQ
jgi:hypothetical protein